MSTLDIAAPVYSKDFSLARAAAQAKVSKPTIKVAIENGVLKATQNNQGHYSIKGQDLFQYIANREADKASQVTDAELSPSPAPVVSGVAQVVSPPPSEPSVPLSVHESVVKTLQEVIADKQNDVEEWRSRVPKLLTYQEEEEELEEEASREGWWKPWVGTGVIVVGSLLVWFRVDLLNWIRSL